MNEKELRSMMSSYRELAYIRRAALLRIQEIVYGDPVSPEERLDKIKEVLTAGGFTYREGD